MFQAFIRRTAIYASIAAMAPKTFAAFQLWFWVSLVLNSIGMTIFFFFWKAVYADTNAIAGLSLTQTLTYILLAQVFTPLTEQDLIWEFGYGIREGLIVHMLLRPVDFQGYYYAQALGRLLTGLVLQIPVALVATLVFGLQWPTDPGAWGAFAVSALLGHAIMFFFHWCLASLTFYTTEVWGLGVLIFGLTLFFSGGFVPLAIMPDWLRTLVLAIPFAQALAIPLNFLSGITPVVQAPLVWLTQLAWLGGMWLLSRAVFGQAVKKITVQGG